MSLCFIFCMKTAFPQEKSWVTEFKGVCPHIKPITAFLLCLGLFLLEIIWKQGLPNSESSSPSARQQLLMDPALYLYLPRCATFGPWQMQAKTCDIVCCEGTSIRNNIKATRETWSYALPWYTCRKAQEYLLFTEHLFLQEVAEDVAFVLQVDILAYVSYIRLCINLLIILLHICKLRIV